MDSIDVNKIIMDVSIFNWSIIIFGNNVLVNNIGGYLNIILFDFILNGVIKFVSGIIMLKFLENIIWNMKDDFVVIYLINLDSIINFLYDDG